ncbi:hypothetical protein HNP84_000454 [Thermocatellispora tengchongensis]|uniref:Uncharacterized protein n=1 Tax=Thermocatellispora tengchongensis TaxID=1073253 RepID=A0A840NX36_9ACTN|nr:hypothetical protein [Thermocatellispora tengchongensis]MBB5130766.1 hypothetical protein [Thermocatellispora tengchongensis]
MSRWWPLSVVAALLGAALFALPAHALDTHALPAHALDTHASGTHASGTHASGTHASGTHASGGALTGHAPSARVALVGVPGLEWSDIDRERTPNLWRLAGEGGAAAMSTRAIPPPDRSITCPIAGWLTVSAGQRAGAPGTSCGLPPLPEATPGGGATVPGWSNLAGFNREQSFGASIGALGQAVADTGGRVAAIGPGAALGAADRSGTVARYAATPEALGDLSPYTLIVMEADNLAKAWIGGGVDGDGEPIPPTEQARQAAASETDRRIGALLARLPARTTVLVAGISDISTSAHLHVAIATGPSPSGAPYPQGHLTASSTRQDALVTLTDLTATTLGTLGVTAPEGVVGRQWVPGGAGPGGAQATVTELADSDLASQVLREVRAPFFLALVIVQVLFYAFAAVAVRRRWGGSRVLVATQVVAVVSGAIAISTFLAQLVPWWSWGSPMAGLIATILGFAGAIAGLAFAGPWRSAVLGPLTVVAAITSLALLLDVMTGSRLQVNAVTGYEPVTGARFYGFGNIAFAVFATSTIMFLAGVAGPLLARGRRALAAGLCAAYGLLAVFADGWPAWGADFGGVLAFVPGLAVFLMLLTGRRVSPARLVLVGVAAAAFIGAISFADWLRPAGERTHLGAFFQQVLDGEAWPVLGRKVAAMVGTLGNLPLTVLSLVALAFLYLILARPSRWGAAALTLAYGRAPTLRAGLFGVLTTALVGFLANDSGIAIPAMALTVAVPLTLAASVRALQLAAPAPAGPGASAATPKRPEPPSEPAEPTARPAP